MEIKIRPVLLLMELRVLMVGEVHGIEFPKFGKRG